MSQLLLQALDAGGVSLGRVLHVHTDGPVLVSSDAVDGGFECELLVTSDDRPLTLAVGDTVLIALTHGATDRSGPHGVILGRVGPSRAAATAADASANRATSSAPASAPEEPPAELVLEARKSLTLVVGDGSITIRADGKILIKGKDLVSHAQRTNRIKGGAVAIN